MQAIDPDAIVRDLLARDPGLRLERYYGEQGIFYNPGGTAPLGVIVAAIKDHDGPNDRAAKLSRPGVYRFAFGLPRDTFEGLFGARPARPAKGEAVALPGFELARLDELMPHPVYAWMCWVQILAPTAARYESLRPLLGESLDDAKRRWERRRPARPER